MTFFRDGADDIDTIGLMKDAERVYSCEQLEEQLDYNL